MPTATARWRSPSWSAPSTTRWRAARPARTPTPPATATADGHADASRDAGGRPGHPLLRHRPTPTTRCRRRTAPTRAASRSTSGPSASASRWWSRRATAAPTARWRASAFDEGGTPDLQVQVTRALGDGSAAVCDGAAPTSAVCRRSIRRGSRIRTRSPTRSTTSAAASSTAPGSREAASAARLRALRERRYGCQMRDDTERQFCAPVADAAGVPRRRHAGHRPRARPRPATSARRRS